MGMKLVDNHTSGLGNMLDAAHIHNHMENYHSFCADRLQCNIVVYRIMALYYVNHNWKHNK